MTSDADPSELLLAYVQSDAAARGERFGEFSRALKALAAKDGPAAARGWAQRAVSPIADFTSLMRLRSFLVPAPADESAKPLRVAILGGPTTTQLRQLIEVFLAGEGIAAEVYEADYGLFRQEILTPGSRLDQFAPQIIILATGARDVARLPGVDLDEVAVQALAAEELADWLALWKTANTRWNATIVQNNFEIAPGCALGHFSLRHPASRENYLERLNGLFAQQAPAYVVLHNLRELAAEAGARDWFDDRYYFEFKMPCGPQCLVAYAYSLVSLMRAIVGRSKKVLVLDLDNTLWGGVVGDLGPGGVRIGQGSSEGEAFVAFQNYARALRERGVLLAVCSKNDEHRAREVFDQRADMILQLSDLSVFVANWENKADNLRTIAERLELGLDSLVFVDDNPAERALVRRLLPQVAVPDMPADPSGYVPALARHRYFETVAFTREDQARASFYAQNAQRRQMAAQSTDLGSFLTSLGMRMRVEPVSEMNLERVTQLINKSNQFNLTTRRYTLAQVREMLADDIWHTLTFSLRDTLGDNGLISIILLKRNADSLEIDSWVMSCRVLQRGVENFARNELVDLARREGCREIRGTYIPSPKNALVAQHFAGLGFAAAGSQGDQTFWSLQVDEDLAPLSHAIEREVVAESHRNGSTSAPIIANAQRSS